VGWLGVGGGGCVGFGGGVGSVAGIAPPPPPPRGAKRPATRTILFLKAVNADSRVCLLPGSGCLGGGGGVPHPPCVGGVPTATNLAASIADFIHEDCGVRQAVFRLNGLAHQWGKAPPPPPPPRQMGEGGGVGVYFVFVGIEVIGV